MNPPTTRARNHPKHPSHPRPDIGQRREGPGGGDRSGKESGTGASRSVAVLALAASLLLAPHALAQTVVTFTPTQSTTVQAPVDGLAAMTDDYILVSAGSSAKLPKNFSGDEVYQSQGNPISGIIDAATYNNSFHFQLTNDRDLIRVENPTGKTTGDEDPSFTGFGLGPGTFGIGYDSDVNRFGVGSYSAGEMTLRLYDVGSTTPLGTPVTFSFNTTQWGTPTGLDYVRIGGQDRFLVSTRDGPNPNPNLSYNYVFDINGNSGSIDQYFGLLQPNAEQLNDILFDKSTGNITLVYDITGEGLVQVGSYAIIPEPNTALLLGLGLGAHVLARRRGRRKLTT